VDGVARRSIFQSFSPWLAEHSSPYGLPDRCKLDSGSAQFRADSTRPAPTFGRKAGVMIEMIVT
jgi:hypothetical protein